MFNKDFRISGISKITAVNLPDISKGIVNNDNLDECVLEMEKDKRNYINYINSKTIQSKNNKLYTEVNLDNTSIFNSSQNKGSVDKDNKTPKGFYCPFCEHCNNSTNELKFEGLVIINEATSFLNKLVDTISSSNYLKEITHEINFKSISFVENIINANVSYLFSLNFLL